MPGIRTVDCYEVITIPLITLDVGAWTSTSIVLQLTYHIKNITNILNSQIKY